MCASTQKPSLSKSCCLRCRWTAQTTRPGRRGESRSVGRAHGRESDLAVLDNQNALPPKAGVFGGGASPAVGLEKGSGRCAPRRRHLRRPFCGGLLRGHGWDERLGGVVQPRHPLLQHVPQRGERDRPAHNTRGPSALVARGAERPHGAMARLQSASCIPHEARSIEPASAEQAMKMVCACLATRSETVSAVVLRPPMCCQYAFARSVPERPGSRRSASTMSHAVVEQSTHASCGAGRRAVSRACVLWAIV